SPDPRHDQTRHDQWLVQVMREVIRTFPTRGRYDGNMRLAAVLSHVLALWYLRVHRAKCYDPRRPVADRRYAFESWLGYVRALSTLAVDERDDAAHFPDQHWDPPYSPHAIDGTFR